MGGWRKTPVALLIISAIDAQGRTLMSAWIETLHDWMGSPARVVALS